MKELGWQVVAISPDAPSSLAKISEGSEIGYRLLSDQDLDAASAFGVAFRLDTKTLKAYEGYGIPLVDTEGAPRPTLPVPAIFLLGPDGRVRFQYVNPDFKQRLDPDVLLAAARAATPEPGSQGDD